MIEAWLQRTLTDVFNHGVTEKELHAARDAEVADIRRQMTALGWQGSRTELLGEGVIFADDPDAYRVLLARQKSVTTAVIRRVVGEWLSRPGARLVVRGS